MMTTNKLLYSSLLLLSYSSTISTVDIASPYPDLSTACTLPQGYSCSIQQWGCTGGMKQTIIHTELFCVVLEHNFLKQH